ncbi:MAG: hypothetical protein A2Y02_02365 [Omnitrophica bacterium GWA2_52_12]|nr:MAG: hypothetical protein A2Y02_02365 [Omnitrophica bacterium GWA2_52_12]
MRPKKTRTVCCDPGERWLTPSGCCQSTETIRLQLDELEAIRLADFEELSQEAVAKKMRVHRSTISRILASARKKVADAIVNRKGIKTEVGCCQVIAPKPVRRKKGK